MSEFWCLILNGAEVHPKYHQPVWGEASRRYGDDAWASVCGQVYRPNYRGGGLFRQKTAERFAEPCRRCYKAAS